MYTIRVEGHFSAAHFLEDYKGLCGSIHGHRWTVVLKLKTKDLNKDSQMIYDFSEMKDALESVMEYLDHSFILDPNGNEASREFYALATKYKMRVVRFSGRTTAENLSRYIYEKIKVLTGWTTHSVEVFEAPTNSVEYEED